MLTLAKCRELVGSDSTHSDAELARLRDQFYGLARTVVESLPNKRSKKAYLNAPDACRRAVDAPEGVREPTKQTTPFEEALALIPEEDRYAVEERAAILEFDGKLDRDNAERLALSFYCPTKPSKN